MAEEEKEGAPEGAPEGGEEGSPEKGKKKLLVAGGGVFGLVLVGYVASLMAAPGEEELPRFTGPYVAPLSEENIQVNLSGGSKSFLVMGLNVKFYAYDEAYLTARVEDPVYKADLMDAVLAVASSKGPKEVLDPAGTLIFLEELKDAIDPILFPVHVGDAAAPVDFDSSSGLRGGESLNRSSLRGPLYEHHLQVDGPSRTIQLDGGEPVTFEGEETDLAVTSPLGLTVYLDVSEYAEDFAGEVMIGTHGRIYQILKREFLVQ